MSPTAEAMSLPTPPDRATVKEITVRTQNMLKCVARYRAALVALSGASHELHQAVKLLCNAQFAAVFPSQRGDNPFLPRSAVDDTVSHLVATQLDVDSAAYSTPPGSPSDENRAPLHASPDRAPTPSTTSRPPLAVTSTSTQPTQSSSTSPSTVPSATTTTTTVGTQSAGVTSSAPVSSEPSSSASSISSTSSAVTRGNSGRIPTGGLHLFSSSSSSSLSAAAAAITTTIPAPGTPHATLINFKPQQDYYTTLFVSLHDLELRIVHETEQPISRGLEDYLALVSKWQDILSAEKKLANQTKSAESRFQKLDAKVKKSGKTEGTKFENRAKAEEKWKQLKKELNEYRFVNNSYIATEEARFLKLLAIGSTSLIKGTAINMGKIVRKAELTCLALGVPLPLSTRPQLPSESLPSLKHDDQSSWLNIDIFNTGKTTDNKSSPHSNKAPTSGGDGTPKRGRNANRNFQKRRGSFDSVMSRGASVLFGYGDPSLDRNMSVSSRTSGILGMFSDQRMDFRNLNNKVEAILTRTATPKDVVGNAEYENAALKINTTDRDYASGTKLKPAIIFKDDNLQYSEGSAGGSNRRAHFDISKPIAVVHGQETPKSLAELYPNIAGGSRISHPVVNTLGSEPAVFLADDAQSMMASLIDIDIGHNDEKRSFRDYSPAKSASFVEQDEQNQENLPAYGDFKAVDQSDNSLNESNNDFLSNNDSLTNNNTLQTVSVRTEASLMGIAERSRQQLRNMPRSRKPPRSVADSENTVKLRDKLPNSGISTSQSDTTSRRVLGPRAPSPSGPRDNISGSPKTQLAKPDESTSSRGNGVVYTKENQKYYHVLHNFTARSGKELNLTKGEIVTVRKTQSTWLYAIRKLKINEIPSSVLNGATDDGSDRTVQVPMQNDPEIRPKTVYSRVGSVVTKKEMGWIPVAFVKEVPKP